MNFVVLVVAIFLPFFHSVKTFDEFHAEDVVKQIHHLMPRRAFWHDIEPIAADVGAEDVQSQIAKDFHYGNSLPLFVHELSDDKERCGSGEEDEAVSVSGDIKIIDGGIYEGACA